MDAPVPWLLIYGPVPLWHFGARWICGIDLFQRAPNGHVICLGEASLSSIVFFEPRILMMRPSWVNHPVLQHVAGPGAAAAAPVDSTVQATHRPASLIRAPRATRHRKPIVHHKSKCLSPRVSSRVPTRSKTNLPQWANASTTCSGSFGRRQGLFEHESKTGGSEDSAQWREPYDNCQALVLSDGVMALLWRQSIQSTFSPGPPLRNEKLTVKCQIHLPHPVMRGPTGIRSARLSYLEARVRGFPRFQKTSKPKPFVVEKSKISATLEQVRPLP
ncbi:hypothetical protein S7711_11343 [Stachybotrys chartarum IBT 7711]|uniref:Uncharacterized protein n=1 Tax=Stachybotrys chartarum (strain CBS 109288 / IBT 7711) TaxID=1280523 RepID=A0A084AX76_STACB|nr:hypothetical protein S7711_11343 [Stachybotrys chartarum IBT 7711]